MKAALLTFEQARQRLNVGKSTLYRLLESGMLRGVKFAHNWRIDPQDLEAFIESKKQGAVSTPHPVAVAQSFDADHDLPQVPEYFQ